MLDKLHAPPAPRMPWAMNCPPMSSGQRMVRQPCRQAEELLSWACLLSTRGVSGANQGSARPGHQQPFTSNSQAQPGILLRIFAELIPFPHGGAPRDGDGRITGTPPPHKNAPEVSVNKY